MKIEEGTKLDFSDVLIKPKRSETASRKDVRLVRDFKFYHSPRVWEGVPIMLSNMDTLGCISVAQEAMKHKIITCLHKYHSADELYNNFKNCSGETDEVINYIWPTVGMKDGDLSNLIEFKHLYGYQPNICIDIANGYTEKFVSYCAKIRDAFPASIIMAGNVCTGEMVEELILHGGVDIVKVGIGGGAFCETRTVAGVGVPQLSAVLDCTNHAHGLSNGEHKLGLVCSDGGVVQIADFAKAFGANADFVMSGSFFIGAEECEGEWKYNIGNSKRLEELEQRNLISNNYLSSMKKKTKLKAYGMSSKEAQAKYGSADYRASEGRCVWINNKGPISLLISEVFGGLRSACAYMGTDYIKHMGKCCTFVRVNNTHNRTHEQ